MAKAHYVHAAKHPQKGMTWKSKREEKHLADNGCPESQTLSANIGRAGPPTSMQGAPSAHAASERGGETSQRAAASGEQAGCPHEETPHPINTKRATPSISPVKANEPDAASHEAEEYGYKEQGKKGTKIT